MMLKFFVRAMSIVALLSFAGSAASETWQHLLNQAETLPSQGSLDSSRLLYVKALSEAESHYTRSDSTVDIVFHPQGYRQPIYFRSYSDAEQTYANFLSSAENIFGSDGVEVSDILLKLAETYRVLGRYAGA